MINSGRNSTLYIRKSSLDHDSGKTNRGCQSSFQRYSTLVVFTSVTHSSPSLTASLAILVPKRSPFYEISISQKSGHVLLRGLSRPHSPVPQISCIGFKTERLSWSLNSYLVPPPPPPPPPLGAAPQLCGCFLRQSSRRAQLNSILILYREKKITKPKSASITLYVVKPNNLILSYLILDRGENMMLERWYFFIIYRAHFPPAKLYRSYDTTPAVLL